MTDPYWRYTASTDRAAIPGYIPSEASTLSYQPYRPSHNDLSSSSVLQKDIVGSRVGVGIGGRPEPSTNGYMSAYEDPYSIGRRDGIHVTGPGTGISDILNDRPDSLRKSDGVGGRESNVLFVDALPSDCSRREVSHLFRPFNGFKEIRLVHKEPRTSSEKAMVLCFVEFDDSNQALRALEALQGYKFDNKKPDSPALRIHFAHFPFQLPSDDDHIQSQPPPDSSRFQSQPAPDSARFPSQPAPESARFLSQPAPESARYLSQPAPDSARFTSQLLSDSNVYPSKLPHDSVYFPSQKPPDRAQFSSQLPPNSVHYSSQLPLSSAHFPSQSPLNSAHSPIQLPPPKEEQDREKESDDEDDEPVVKTKKFKGGSSKKKGKVEEGQKKWCIKCKQNHFGECYNFKNCYICGKPGHIGKECTNKPRLCYGCGQPGHIHSLCPNGPRPEKKGKGSGASVKKEGRPET